MSDAQEWNGISVPTLYKGIQFRSRLEARWAIFFDELGIEWDYEPETFETKYGYYMPDFFLPSINRWFIVKGTKIPDDESKKVLELSRITAARAIIAEGSIPEWFDFHKENHQCNYLSMLDNRNGQEGGDWGWMPCFCPQCGRFDFQFEGRYERNCECVNSDGGYYEPPNPKIVRALQKARTAYFNQETKQFTVRNF